MKKYINDFKYIWSRLDSTQRKPYWLFLWAIILLCVITIILFISQLCIKASLYEGLFVSFFTSLVFSIVLGSVTFFYSIQKLSSYSLEERILHLLNASRESEEYREDIKKKIRELIVVSTEAQMTIEFLEFSKKLDAVKMKVILKRTMKNLTWDTLENFEIKTGTTADVIDNSDNGLVGEIYYASAIRNHKEETKIFYRNKKLIETDFSKKECSSINIDKITVLPNEEFYVEVCYWVWYRKKEIFVSTRVQFTHKQRFEIVNKTNVELSLKNLQGDVRHIVLNQGCHYIIDDNNPIPYGGSRKVFKLNWSNE